MLPFRFGPDNQPLYGVLHPAATEPARMAVLLCNPWGQEAIRIHRFYRVLADRLAHAGIATLRFDYYGTGESAGDDLDGDLTRWRADIHSAHIELKRRTACQAIAWVGARLGGTLACMAASEVAAPPTKLLVWEPVLDGHAYLKALAADHVKALRNPYRPPMAAAGDRPRGEALGFAMSEGLMAQIASIECSQFTPLASVQTTVLAQPGDATMAKLVEHLSAEGHPTRLLRLAETFQWTADEALNTALVPPAALQRLATTLEEVLD